MLSCGTVVLLGDNVSAVVWGEGMIRSFAVGCVLPDCWSRCNTAFTILSTSASLLCGRGEVGGERDVCDCGGGDGDLC